VEFLWDGDVLCEERDSSKEAGTEKRVHVHEPGTFVPMLQVERGEAFVVVNDHLGMPKELIDSAGRVAWRATHGAWGDVRGVERDRGAAEVESPFRLLGQYADRETGLCYTRFRYFEAATGRWLSADPLGIAGGLNTTAFDGSPTRLSDVLGLNTGPCPTVRPDEISGGKHAWDRPLQDVIAQAGLRPKDGGRPIPIGRWLTPQAPQDAANRMTPGVGRQVVDLQPGEGVVVYGGVQSYPPDSGSPTSLIVPADKALIIVEQNGTVHTFPIDDSHYLHGPAGARPVATKT
jgi:RHS repeat-associated protein